MYKFFSLQKQKTGRETKEEENELSNAAFFNTQKHA
jgi:hypothetical protein